MKPEFANQQLKVVRTDKSVEFHATDESQVQDEDLIWSLYRPMLALSLLTMPAIEKVPRKAEYDDEYMDEMKKLFGEKNTWATELTTSAHNCGDAVGDP